MGQGESSLAEEKNSQIEFSSSKKKTRPTTVPAGANRKEKGTGGHSTPSHRNHIPTAPHSTSKQRDDALNARQLTARLHSACELESNASWGRPSRDRSGTEGPVDYPRRQSGITADGVWGIPEGGAHNGGERRRLSEASTNSVDSDEPRPTFGADGDEFLLRIRKLLDLALKLLGSDANLGAKLISGLLRKSGAAQDFIDKLVALVNERLDSLTANLDVPKLVYALSKAIYLHIRAEEKMDEGLRNGAQGKLGAFREWKRCGGMWPQSLPDPDQAGQHEATFDTALEEGLNAHLKVLSGRLLDLILPSDNEAGMAQLDSASQTAAQQLQKLRNLVLVPSLVQVLHSQVLNRLTAPDSVNQMLLQSLNPGAIHNPMGFGEMQSEAFQAVASVVGQIHYVPPQRLRMQLMQGLVKMTVDGRRYSGSNAGPLPPAPKDPAAESASTMTGLFEIPMLEELHDTLAAPEKRRKRKQANDDELQTSVEMELEMWLKHHLPLRKLAPPRWMSDRVEASLHLANAPTNLPLLLSLLEVATRELGHIPAGPMPPPRGRRQLLRREKARKCFARRCRSFCRSDLSYVASHLARRVLGPDLVQSLDGTLKGVTLEHASLDTVLKDTVTKGLERLDHIDKPALAAKAKVWLATVPLAELCVELTIQRLLRKYRCDFSNELGSDGAPRLSIQFRKYAFAFTETLISRLVGLRCIEEGRLHNPLDAISLKETRARHREEVIHEILSFPHSKDLLCKLQTEWLPQISHFEKDWLP